MTPARRASRPYAAYVRVSRTAGRDDDRLRSPDLQRQAIERYAAAEGLSVVWTEPELDVSGSRAQRPILDDIIARVQSGELAGVVVARLDRLSRMRPRDRVEMFEAIEDAGGRVLSASEQIDPSTPEGRFARDVFLGVARMAWERYRDGFREAQAGATARGVPVHSRIPPGYRQAEDRTLEVDPDVAPKVREAFERRARGDGPTSIGRFLEAEGVRTANGSKGWTARAVRALLGNRVFIGELRFGGNVNPAAHPAIVPLELFLAAQHPNGRGVAPTKGKETRWLVAGIIRCAGCNYAAQGTTTSSGQRVYRCQRRHASGICPAPARIDAETVEAKVTDIFWTLTADLQAKGTRESGADLERLQEELERASTAFDQYMSPAVQDAIGDAAVWAAGLRERREARDAAAAALGEARAAVEPDDAPDVESLRNAWSRMTTVEKRELLSLRLDAVMVSKAPLELTVYPAGTAPADLPRRGGKRAPVAVPA